MHILISVTSRLLKMKANPGSVCGLALCNAKTLEFIVPYLFNIISTPTSINDVSVIRFLATIKIFFFLFIMVTVHLLEAHYHG